MREEKELNFDSYLTHSMNFLSLDEATECCSAILNGLEYADKENKLKEILD